jgi:hypothetical protein
MATNDVVLLASFMNTERQLEAVGAFEPTEIAAIKLGYINYL